MGEEFVDIVEVKSVSSFVWIKILISEKNIENPIIFSY